MSKARNHYIPRVLLNRFSSRSESGKRKRKYWIWQIGKDSPPREVSTRDTALSKFFYGKPETGVEDAFQKHETSFSKILREIDKDVEPDNYHQELNDILWLFYVRTRALRENFGDGFNLLLNHIPDLSNTQQFKAQVFERLKTQLCDPKKIEQLVERLPPEKRAVFSAVMAAPQHQEAMRQLIEKMLKTADLTPLVETFVSGVKKEDIVAKSTKEAHVNALSNIMTEQKTSALFNPTNWDLIESTGQKLILGDACMFAVTHDGTPFSILRAAKNWQEIYFPISSTQVLVAQQGKKTPSLTIDQINQASAEIASSYIYSSWIDHKVKALSQAIGTKAPFLTKKEAAALKEKKLRELS